MGECWEDELSVRVPGDVAIGKLATVEFPLAVRPTNKGLDESLALIGGIRELARVTADEERALKLHARPKDPLCRPLVAERNASTRPQLVFKVKRRRVRPRPGSEEQGEGAGIDGHQWSMASVEAVASVHTAFTFDSLADVQFVSSRPRDVKAEDAIEEHINAAASREEPIEILPHSFLPSFPRVSQESRHEKMMRRDKKQNEAVRVERGELQLTHSFGDNVKHRTKKGNQFVEEAKGIEHLREQLDLKWVVGKKRDGKKLYRPTRLRKGISGHHEVREQQLLVGLKIIEAFEKRTMYFMSELDAFFQNENTWAVRDLVPAVAYFYRNGPWRNRWVRFGYRPEDDPLARFEQSFEFRVSSPQLRAWAEALSELGGISGSQSRRKPPAKGSLAGGSKKRAAGRDEEEENQRREDQATSGLTGDVLGDDKNVPRAEDASSGTSSPTVAGAPTAAAGVEDGTREGEAPKDPSPRGVVPDVTLISRTKARGKFASQVVLNGKVLLARNRQVVAQCAFRAVQELALSSPRLDKPDKGTGWWPQNTLEKMRQVTMESIDACIKIKRQWRAAAAVLAASAANKTGHAVASSPGDLHRQSPTAARGVAHDAHASDAFVPAALSREEFYERAARAEADVQIVSAPPPLPPQLPRLPSSGGAPDKNLDGRVSSVRGVRDGKGRSAAPDAAAAAAAVAGARHRQQSAISRADRESVGSSTDEDDEPHSDDVHSSDLVDDSEDDAYSEDRSEDDDSLSGDGDASANAGGEEEASRAADGHVEATEVAHSASHGSQGHE